MTVPSHVRNCIYLIVKQNNITVLLNNITVHNHVFGCGALIKYIHTYDFTFKNTVIVCIPGPVRMMVDVIVSQNFSHSVQLVLIGKSCQFELRSKVEFTLFFGLITSISFRSIFGDETEVVHLKTYCGNTLNYSLDLEFLKSLTV